MTTTYYVKASISADGSYAACSYYYDQAGTRAVEGSLLTYPKGDTTAYIAPADGCELLLIGATFKTIGHAPKLTSGNFCAADASNVVTVPFPPADEVIKGVVLLFSNVGDVEALYASSDPEVSNGGDGSA